MQINLKSFNQVVQDMGAALQGSASALVDMSVGSVVRAIFEANAGIALWIQWLILQVLSMTRASTSVGSDLDTWMADFGLVRLTATPASGTVTLSRYSLSQPALVPVGTQLKTADGTLSFVVYADSSLPMWQQQSSSYLVPSGVASIDVPIQCSSAGSAGNALASTITVIASSIPGVDQVSNENALTNGLDVEGDANLRSRFQIYLGSLSKATRTAVASAISNARQGLSYQIKENVGSDGVMRSGTFTVLIDDGTGYPSADLLATVASAIDAVRPVGTMFTVLPPTVQLVNVSVTVQVAPGAPAPAVASLQQQVTSYLDGLPVESLASITRIAQNIYGGNPNIDNVTNIMINGTSADLQPVSGTVFKAGQISVAVNGG
jgi:uncharacterized phage protein gp47/JayE